MSDQMQKEFEAWYMRRMEKQTNMILPDMEPNYTNRDVADLWESWQAARAADKARIEILESANVINMPGLLEDLDVALEDLELHGRHSDQGYQQLRAWYNEIRRVTRSLKAALAQQGKEGGA